jgi:hypothetical protein
MCDRLGAGGTEPRASLQCLVWAGGGVCVCVCEVCVGSVGQFRGWGSSAGPSALHAPWYNGRRRATPSQALQKGHDTLGGHQVLVNAAHGGPEEDAVKGEGPLVGGEDGHRAPHGLPHNEEGQGGHLEADGGARGRLWWVHTDTGPPR